MRWLFTAAAAAASAALLGGVGLLTAAGAAQNNAAPEPPRFPAVTASNLEGRRYDLPKGFEGEKNLVLIAFTQGQQFDIDTWLDGIQPLQEVPGFEAYELPTLGPGTPQSRAWLDGVMRAGIPDKKQRERTITLYLDKPAFRRALGLPDERRVYALLVDRAGRVRWRAEGRYTEEHGKSLRAALKASPPAGGG